MISDGDHGGMVIQLTTVNSSGGGQLHTSDRPLKQAALFDGSGPARFPTMANNFDHVADAKRFWDQHIKPTVSTHVRSLARASWIMWSRRRGSFRALYYNSLSTERCLNRQVR